MTDWEFTQLLKRVIKANDKYKELLKLAEQEYELRFEYNPSDIDDDNWIDIFHIGDGGFKGLEQIKKEAELCVMYYKDNNL